MYYNKTCSINNGQCRLFRLLINISAQIDQKGRKMANDTDRRAVRTRKAIRHAALELLKKKDIAKITVSEITEIADIGRGTFYLHYTDPYDLLDKIEDGLLEEITAHAPPLLEHRDNESLLDHLERIWRYVHENKEAFSVLLNRHNNGRFMEKFKRYCENTALAGNTQPGGPKIGGTIPGDTRPGGPKIGGTIPGDTRPGESTPGGSLERGRSYEDYYGIIYVIAGSLGIFQKWMEEDAPIPPDRLAQIVRNLITGG